MASTRLGSLAPLMVVILAGVLLTTQTFINSRLGLQLGSSLVAASFSAFCGTTALLVVVLARRTLATSSTLMRRSPERRLWPFFGGVAGGAMIGLVTYAAPLTGLALLTVAIVAGQTIGGLMIDTVGIGSATHYTIGVRRILGVILAIAAVTIAAVTTTGTIIVVLLALVALAGVGFAFQQASMGAITQITGDPAFASALTFFVSGVTLALAALATGSGVTTLSAPPVLLVGGLLGACVGVAIAWAVPRVGVLTVALCLVAGQSAGAILLDLIFPVSGEKLTVYTLIAAGLAFVAVAASGSPKQR